MEATCPICGATDAGARESLVGPAKQLRVCQCYQCGFVYAPTALNDRERHGTPYHDARVQAQSPAMMTANAAEFLAFWSATLGWPSAVTILEIGCAEGRLLEVARCMGYDAEGIDVTDYY